MCQLARDAGGTHPVAAPRRVHLLGSPSGAHTFEAACPPPPLQRREVHPSRASRVARGGSPPTTLRRHWPATGQPGRQWVDAQKGRALALLGIGGDHTAGRRSLGVAPGTLAAGHVGRGASA
ncbi:hypothetical protein MTO96_013895 [Rhipicephalus appendiculatus]